MHAPVEEDHSGVCISDRATVPSCQWGPEVCCRAPTPPPAPSQLDGVRANTTDWQLAELTVEGDDLLLRLSFNKCVIPRSRLPLP